MIETILAIVVLLAFSAFFSGSETALTAASRPLMHQLEQDGDARAAVVNQLHAHKERLISAILLGNNLVNIFASALATSVCLYTFGDAGVAYATVAMTLLVLIFAEILPKTYAFHHANQAARGVARTVKVLVWVLTPITNVINALVAGLLRSMGARYGAEDAFRYSEHELRGAIELHQGRGGTDDVKQARDMLRSVLDLGAVQVGEIMVHRKNVAAVDADLPPEDAVAAILESPYTRIPLWRDDPDNVIGVIHAKALLRELHSRGRDVAGLDLTALATEPWFIPEQTLLADQLDAFRARREHFALVVDEYGSLMGVVTLEDILEEIVGEIDDEHDVSVTGVTIQPDGTYLVDGAVTIRDLNREFEWSLPDEGAATIAGLVLHEARHIPAVGQKFRFHGLRFEIVRRHRHQITLLRIKPPARPPADG